MLSLLRIAWRNLWRHRRRTLITAGAMAVGVAMCMATMAFSDGMYRNLFDVMVVQRLGHVQVHHPERPASRSLHDTLREADALIATLEDAEGTAAVSGRLEGFVLLGTERKSEGAMLIGIEPVRERAVTPIADRLRAGTFLGPEPAGQIVVGYELAEDLQVGVGDELVAVTQAADGSLGNTLFTVSGVVRTGDVQIDRMGGYVHLAELRELLVLPDQLHNVTIVTSDDRTIGAYAERLRERLARPQESGARRTGQRTPLDTTAVQNRGSLSGPAVRALPMEREIEVQPWYEASPQSAQMMAMRDFGSFMILGIVFGAAAFGVLNTMMMSVFERTRELGVLKALGLRPGRMVALIVSESVMLAVVAMGIGLVLGGAIDAYLVVYGLDMSTTAEEGFSFAGVMLDPVIRGEVRASGIVWIAAAVLGVSVAASLWPALRASRLEPVQAMRAD
jgi:ABC-type lipoprotein release transport system permease subunit